MKMIVFWILIFSIDSGGCDQCIQYYVDKHALSSTLFFFLPVILQSNETFISGERSVYILLIEVWQAAV